LSDRRRTAVRIRVRAAATAALLAAIGAPATPAFADSPGIGVSSTRVVSGAAALETPADCTTRPYAVTVRGRALRSVTFFADGRRVRRVRDARGLTSVSARLRRTGRARRARVRITFVRSSRTSARVLRATILACAPVSTRPSSTG
jgi:hypothetical protein